MEIKIVLAQESCTCTKCLYVCYLFEQYQGSGALPIDGI